MNLLQRKLKTEDDAIAKADEIIDELLSNKYEEIFVTAEDNGELYVVMYYLESTNTKPIAQVIINKKNGKIVNAFKTNINKF